MDSNIESGIETSPDMSSSNEFLEGFPSPDRMAMLKPRTLIYDETEDVPPLQTTKAFAEMAQHRKAGSDDDLDSIDSAQNNNVIKPNYRHLNLAANRMQIESPPYRKVRALRCVTNCGSRRFKFETKSQFISDFRLFDTPATPKTILQKSELMSTTGSTNRSLLKSLQDGKTPAANVPTTPSAMDRPKAFPVHNKMFDSITANINPFSPSSSEYQFS